jgi:hypothetical protein
MAVELHGQDNPGAVCSLSVHNNYFISLFENIEDSSFKGIIRVWFYFCA